MKYFLKSKTLWLNVITLVLVVLALPQFISIIPATWLPFIALISAFLNAVLRLYFTNQPITFNGTSAS